MFFVHLKKTGRVFSVDRDIKSRGIPRKIKFGSVPMKNPPRSSSPGNSGILRFSPLGAASGCRGVYRVAATGFSVCGSRRTTHPWPSRAPTSPRGPDAQHVTRGAPGRSVDRVANGGGQSEARGRRCTERHVTHILPTFRESRAKRLLSVLLPRGDEV